MMNEKTELWQIIHIPDKPPISPTEQPTVNAFASVIEPKLANTFIRRLNQIAPLENLRHVKRIQKRHDEKGKNQLSVILCLASETENDKQSNNLPENVQELINSYQFVNMLQHLEKSGKSNANFGQHHIIHLLKDSQSVFDFMKVAVDLAKSGGGLMVNAAVIVDPSVQQIIATGHDQIYSWHNKTGTENSHLKKPASFASNLNSNGASHLTVFPNNLHNGPERLYVGVSCLSPWQWCGQQLDMETSCYLHPLRHAAIVAIESSAERDRRLFPGLLHTEKSFEVESMQSSCAGSPAKRQKTNLANVEDGKELDAHSEATSVRPYLCTGYDIYLVWEPCTMCAMALVHQRIRRIFYAFPNPNAGALGSVHRLQGEKSLNHHYAVFRVVLPQ